MTAAADSQSAQSAWSALTVDLPAGPPEPTDIEVTSPQCPSPCTEPLATDSPTLSATSAASSGTQDLEFQVWDGDNLVASEVIPSVEAGAAAAWTVPGDRLASGEYLARVGARDDVGETTWTTWHPLAVLIPDPNTEPAAPAGSYEDPGVATSDTFDATREPLASRNTDELNGTGESSYASRDAEPKPQEIAMMYAPILTVDQSDSSNPLSATNFINNSTLTWHHQTYPPSLNCKDAQMVRSPDPAKLGSTTDVTYSRRANPSSGSCAPTGTQYWPWDKVKPNTQDDGGPPRGQGMYISG